MNQQVEQLRTYRSLQKSFKIMDNGGSTVTVIGRKNRGFRRTFSQATWQIVKAMELADRAAKKKDREEMEVEDLVRSVNELGSEN